MDPPERHQELRAGFAVAPALLHHPQEGMFWQANHILPVSEGGGEADLTNLRTLRTLCYQKETRRLQNRLKCAEWGRNAMDIRQSMLRTADRQRVELVSCDDSDNEDVIVV